MKHLFTLESLTPVASILDEKGVKFTQVGIYLQTSHSDSQFIMEYLDIAPVEEPEEVA